MPFAISASRAVAVALDDLDGVARVELALDLDDADRQQARAALAQRPRGPASTTSVPRAGFAYFSHSLNEL